ncbi:LexA family transcriptional regulator [Candidatus Kaistella beijingensis]|uniref:XRE family transcriptional regulator n=1 Tax=Candidatus Kaistella beijingensis TaxID=2820270 RepID=UPI001CC33727|nr:LexA family transcriptional regulator [Candidatus Kaistella beijingensis]UBB90972.1 LexA family transcriptional regulator [Candidatus Kaistella beijingensis]
MSIFSENIRLLRDRQNLTQQKIADDLKITRGRYVKYEDGSSEPPLDLLLKIAKYFNVSIDILLSVDIRKYPLEQMVKISENKILVPVAVDSKGENKIEIIPTKASMGYLNGYQDPDYIEGLQTLSLPFLRNGKFRAFPAGGDSMPPYKDGTYIVGKYVENIADLKTDRTYIFVTANDGIVYKRFQFHEGNSICVKSDNNFYEPFKIPLPEIFEIWEFACSISTQEYEPENVEVRDVKEMFLSLKEEISLLRGKK